MPEPPDTPRPFAACVVCGKKSRAAITTDSDGLRHVRYVAAGKPPAAYVLVVTGFNIRADQAERLAQMNNASAFVRLALDNALDRL